MQVTETLSDGLKRGYTVVVPADDLETRRKAKLAELGRGLNLPGFRPGKVPSSVVRQRYGAAVIAEVLQESVNEATERMLADRGLRPAVPPKVDVVAPGLSAAEAGDLEFKVELEVLPEIKMPDFSTIQLRRVRAEPDEEAMTRTLEWIAVSSATLEPIAEERGAATGELLTIDFAGEIDGEPFAGGTGTKTDIEVAGQGLVPGFSEQLEGMRPGETRTVSVTFPADYGKVELAGKEARFAVTASALSRRVVPPIDDELGKRLGFEGLDALKDAVRRQMQEEYDSLTRLRVKRALLDALAAIADFAPPEGLVAAEFDAIWKRVEAERAEGRVEPEDAAKDVDTLKAEYRAIAERRVRLALLLAEVGRANGIAVSEEEIGRALRAEAGRYRGREADVMEFYRRNPRAVDGLRGPILEDKVIDFVLELAQVTDQTVTPEELMKEPPAEPQAA
jgi:trigger factor